ncbi:MAG: FAD-dependent oxidoreductase [Caldimonas sp.]
MAGSSPPAASARPHRLVLLGGGHAHLQVLRDLATAPLLDVHVTLVSLSTELVYSGMVPGRVAGRYRDEECRIPLEPLARRAGVEFIVGEAIGVDATNRSVLIARRAGTTETRGYDVASLDVGGVMDRESITGAAEHALFVRPIGVFLDALGARLRGSAVREISRDAAGDVDGAAAAGAARRAPPDDLVVIGGGAGGVELALALRARRGPIARIALVCGGPLLAAHSAALQRRVRRALAERGVAVHEATCRSIAADAAVLDNGAKLTCDLAIVATGSAAPAWLRPSGLALDADGFVATGPTLQSLSHPEVFGAGDVATRADARRPRNGVHAVRAGPPLARNLRLFVEGRPCRPYRPQRRSLALIACGDGSAIAEWHGWSLEGPAIGRWKDRIDRDFVALNRAA